MNSKKMLRPITFERIHHSKKRYVMYALVVTFHFLLFGCSLSDMGDPIDIQRPDPPNNHPVDETCPCENPESFAMVYETSFEDVEKKDAHTLTWDFRHWIEFAANHNVDGGTGDGNGGAHFWLETDRTHTGAKSIGLELFDIEKSRRAEFVIFPGDYLKKEYCVSYWLYLPENWGLFEPNIDWDWYEIGQPYSTAGQPYSSIIITRPDENQEYYTVALRGRDKQGRMLRSAETEKRLLLPKGRWFHVYYQVRRDVSDGAVKLWFDGQLIGERSGYPTMDPSIEKFNISIAKIYYERGDKVPHQLWVDDLKLYTKPDNQ